jgi:RHS repeat-associated protein
VYNEINQLTQVKTSGGTVIASYTYDDQGRRTSATASGSTVYYHYSGDKVIYVTDGNNIITADYTYDAAGNPATLTYGGVTYYYHLDGHGSVTALTDGSGNIAAQYTYDAWGNILSQTGSMASINPFRYSGYRYDEATGLYYLMARYYDASVGRFISRDSFNGISNDPLRLNQYAYCTNNPVNYSDPSGHWYVQGWGWGVRIVLSHNETMSLVRKLAYISAGCTLITIISVIIPDPTITKIVAATFAILAVSYGTLATVIWTHDNGKGVYINASITKGFGIYAR